MTSFQFRGFPNNGSVELSVSQGSASVDVVRANWGQNASFDIERYNADNMPAIAGAALWFEVTNITDFAMGPPTGTGNIEDPSARDITWVWDFDDPSSVPATLTNLPTAWKDTNVAYGRRVAHVFEAPGLYDITCVGIDQLGESYTASFRIVVDDPDIIYSGNKTICFNPPGDGDFTGKPLGAQQSLSWADVQTRVAALGDPAQSRILFKRGATYTLNGSLKGTSNFANFRLGAYGSGDRPILTSPAAKSSGDYPLVDPERWMKSAVINDIDFRGHWDAATETGYNSSPLYLLFRNADISLHNCKFSGFEEIQGGGLANQRVTFSKCEIHGWRNQGIFFHSTDSQDSATALIGTAIHQLEDALHGQKDGRTNLMGNAHGPVRFEWRTRAFISACSFFSRNGWSTANHEATNAPHTAAQACIRINTNLNSNYDPSQQVEWYTDRCYFEGGSDLINMGAQHSGETERPGNYVFDKILCVGTCQSTSAITAQYGGTTIRNMIGFYPDVPSIQLGFGSFINFGSDKPVAENLGREQRVYGSSFVALATTAENNFARLANGNTPVYPNTIPFRGTDTFDDETLENNIVWAPNQDDALTADGPIDLSLNIPGVQTLFRGSRWNFRAITGAFVSDVPDGGSFSVSYPDDTSDHPNGAATDQAYFQTNAGDTFHWINVGGTGDTFFAELGEISVLFGTNDITITNNTGATWTGGSDYTFMPDRTSHLPALDIGFDSPLNIPLPRQSARSSMGLRPARDFFGQVRPQNIVVGAVEQES